MNDFEKRTIFVTGATGFVGKHLVSRLLALEADVHIVQRGARDETGNSRCTIWNFDLRDLDRLSNTVEKIQPEFVFHLAASRAEDNWKDLCDVNVSASLALLNACALTGVAKLVSIGSSLELLPEPTSAFAASRSASSTLMQTHAKKWGQALTHIRTGYIYGPGMAEQKFVPCAIKAALQGTQIYVTPESVMRSYLHVSDLVDACLVAASSKTSEPQIKNVLDDELYSARDILSVIGELNQKPIDFEIDDAMIRNWDGFDWDVDSLRQQRLQRWNPTVNLRTGLKQMLEQVRGAYEN